MTSFRFVFNFISMEDHYISLYLYLYLLLVIIGLVAVK